MLHILLPVHNRKEITRGFIDCLLAQSLRNFNLILIDDGSTDGTAEMVQQRIPNGRLFIVRGDGNLWWAGSLQQGLNTLKALTPAADDVVLIINDDVAFPATYLENAQMALKAERGALLLSRLRDAETGQVRESGIAADLRCMSFRVATRPELINCLSTRGLFLHWESLRTLGDFHPRLLPHYLSDYEFTMRAHTKGLRCITREDVWLESNRETTGFHSFESQRGLAFLKDFFSRKNAANPLYLSAFILLAVPPRWIPVNLARIWKGAITTVATHLR